MKWLSKLFRKEESKKVEPKKTTWIDCIDGQDYSIDDFDIVKVQSIDNDIRPYGYTIEINYRYNDRDNWYTYHTNKIYISHSSAMSALISVKKFDQGNHDFRITAIYAMDQNFYRNYKINKLFDENQPPVKKYELKAWRLNKDFMTNNGQKLSKDKSVFIQLENGRIIRAATPNDPTSDGTYRRFLFEELIPKGLVEEIELKDEKWLYPHLLKELKTKIKK
jgi:hypothetical protein